MFQEVISAKHTKYMQGIRSRLFQRSPSLTGLTYLAKAGTDSDGGHRIAPTLSFHLIDGIAHANSKSYAKGCIPFVELNTKLALRQQEQYLNKNVALPELEGEL
jgi:hypothetical protein